MYATLSDVKLNSKPVIFKISEGICITMSPFTRFTIMCAILHS